MVDRWTGQASLFLNIVLPGSGTVLTGIIGSKCQMRLFLNNLVVALMQVSLVPYALVGWIWSIYTGILIYEKSGGAWMGLRRVEYVSENEKMEKKQKEKIKQFVARQLQRKGGDKRQQAEIPADSEYWKQQFMN